MIFSVLSKFKKIVKFIILNISSDKEEVVNNAQNLFEILRKKIDPNIIIKPLSK